MFLFVFEIEFIVKCRW